MLRTAVSALLLSGGLAAAADMGVEGVDWYWGQPLTTPQHELVKRGLWNSTTGLADAGLDMLSPFRHPLSEPLGLEGAGLLLGRAPGLEARQQFRCSTPGFGVCPNGRTCAPPDGHCCPNGGYCDASDYCTMGGCCPDGKVCSGSTNGCSDSDMERCRNGADFCARPGADCCTDGEYRTCKAGTQCYNSWCCPAGKVPCHKCELQGDDECGDRCMPRGSVCCGDYVCPADTTCVGDRRCRPNGSGGGGGAGGAPPPEPEPSSTSEWKEPETSTSEWKEPETSTSEWKEPETSTSEWKEPETSTSEDRTTFTPTSTYVPIAGGDKSPTTTTSLSLGPEATARTVSMGGLSITSVNPDDIAWQGNWTRTWACSGDASITNSLAAATVRLAEDVQGYSMSWDLETYTEIEIDNDGRKSTIKSGGSSFGTTEGGCKVNYAWTFDSPGVHQVFFRTVYYGQRRQEQISATLNEMNIYDNKEDVPTEGGGSGSSSSSSGPVSAAVSRTSAVAAPADTSIAPAQPQAGAGRAGASVPLMLICLAGVFML